MMRSLRERCPIRFCRQEIEPAIYLKCIRADDFGTNFMRDIGGELGFASRCGADDEEGACHQSNHAAPDSPGPLYRRQNRKTRAQLRRVSRLKSPISANFELDARWILR